MEELLKNPNFDLCLIFFVLLAIFFVIGIIDAKNNKKKLLEYFRCTYGKKSGKDKLPIGYKKYYEEKRGDSFFIDEITASDISLDDVFMKLDNCLSVPGYNILYSMLRLPKLNSIEIGELVKDCDSFDDDIIRENIQLELCTLGRNSRKSVFDFFKLVDISGKNNLFSISLLLFYIIGIVLLITNAAVGIVVLIILLCVSILSYFRLKSKYSEYIEPAYYLLRILKSGRNISEYKSDKDISINTKIDALSKRCKKLKKTFAGSGYVFLSSNANKNLLSSITQYLNMLFHIDLILFYSIYKKIKANKEEFISLYEDIGYIDACISINIYKKSLKVFCNPSFDESKIIKDLYHPLIKDAVANDTHLNKAILISGSNASGKSTYLKSIALSIVMAQGIGLVNASEYKMPILRLYSSMSVRDSIAKGDSYFMAEIKALKRIIDASDGGDIPVACFIDEILKGTNTAERIAASCQILKMLCGRDMVLATATHDQELTYLLKDYVANYHFTENMESEDVRFTFHILEGPSDTTNAIKLLRRLGYDGKLTDNAQLMVDNHEKTKEWALI